MPTRIRLPLWALTAFTVAALAGCGQTTTATTATTVAATGPTTPADVRQIVSKYAGITAEPSSVCDLTASLQNGKIVKHEPGMCSIQVDLLDTPVFGTEEELLNDVKRVFRDLFATARDPNNQPVQSVFISITGPVSMVGGKTKQEVVWNANCTRQAAAQIDWDVISVADFEQLCKVRKFVPMK